MGFVNLPGYSYTEPVDWHPATVYRHEARSSVRNHDIQFTGTQSCLFRGSTTGNGLYQEPFPDWSASGSTAAAAWACCNTWANVGMRVGGVGDVWSGLCPTSASPPSFGGGLDGTRYEGNYSEGGVIANTASATATISGWTLSPWKIHAGYNTTMDDSALLDEWSAAIVASYPGDGWELEEEGSPTFLGFEVAPDEDPGFAQPFTEVRPVEWIYDPPTGLPVWAYYGPVSGWGWGNTTFGTSLCEYNGGTADWVSVPAEWQPTPDPNPWVCGFVTPEDEDAAAIALTLIGYRIVKGIENGRSGQDLAIRAGWKTPKFRWRRTGAVVPPRRIFQRRDGATHGAQGGLLRGTKTVQQSNHTIGGIL